MPKTSFVPEYNEKSRDQSSETYFNRAIDHFNDGHVTLMSPRKDGFKFIPQSLNGWAVFFYSRSANS
jgi:hypothetical protein